MRCKSIMSDLRDIKFPEFSFIHLYGFNESSLQDRIYKNCDFQNRYEIKYTCTSNHVRFSGQLSIQSFFLQEHAMYMTRAIGVAIDVVRQHDGCGSVTMVICSLTLISSTCTFKPRNKPGVQVYMLQTVSNSDCFTMGWMITKLGGLFGTRKQTPMTSI